MTWLPGSRPTRGPTGDASEDEPNFFEDDDSPEVTQTVLPPTEDRIPVAPLLPLRDRVTLTMILGPEPGSVYTLSQPEIALGRARDCFVRIDDGGVSRHHARITSSSHREYFVEDLGSRNGTLVNGRKIAGREALSDADRIGLGPSVSFRFTLADEDEEWCQRHLYESSVRDGLTGISNRRYFDERLVSEVAFAQRHGQELSLLLMDLDHFKLVNDRFGHQAGDHVLTRLCQLIERSLRAEDVFARYGGEELAVLVRGIDLEHSVHLAERIRVLVEDAEIECQGARVSVTVSIGVASLSQCPGGTGTELVTLADRRLYVAKRAGRNRWDAKSSPARSSRGPQ